MNSRTPSDVIADAELLGQVIETTNPEGIIAEYISIGDVLPRKWVVSFSDARESYIMPREAVRRDIEMCTPDVSLIDRETSTFAGESDESDGREPGVRRAGFRP